MKTVRVIVLMLVGIAIGSLIRPVQGQTNAVFFLIGQRLTLSYGDRTVDCTVAEIRGSFVRCEQVKPDPFTRFPNHTTWHNIATVMSVSIRESQQ